MNENEMNGQIIENLEAVHYIRNQAVQKAKMQVHKRLSAKTNVDMGYIVVHCSNDVGVEVAEWAEATFDMYTEVRREQTLYLSWGAQADYDRWKNIWRSRVSAVAAAILVALCVVAVLEYVRGG